MTFISPAALWALPLAGLPLLLHLLARRQARRLRFSDLSLLRRVYARALPRTRLMQWLLLAARTGLIGLLILGYAQPVLEGRRNPSAASPSEGLDVVLLLDASYSMRYREAGRTRFELAQQRGIELLHSLGPADRAAVAVFSDRMDGPALRWRTAAEAAQTLSRARPGFRSTDLSAALSAAQAFLAGDGRRRAVVLLSDGARHGFRQAVARDPGVAWLALEWPGSAPNSSLVAAGPAQGSTAAKPRLAVRASGLTGLATVDVWLSGRRAQTVSLKGGGESSQLVELPAVAAGQPPAWFGRAALRPDALPDDDQYFFSFRHPARPKVLCLYGDPAFFKAPRPGFFLREMLGGAREGLLGLTADFAALDRLGELPLRDYQAVLLAEAQALPPSVAAALRVYVERGGGLWVLPGCDASEDALASLEELLPARLGALVAGEEAGVRAAPAADARLARGFDLSRVEASRYRLVTIRPGAAVWLRTIGGYPLLVLGSRKRGRVAFWASSLDPAASNVVVKPVFPALLDTVVEALAGGPSRPSEQFQALVGQTLTRVWQPDEAAPDRVRFRSPDGSSTSVYVRDRRAEFALTSQPGLYEMLEEGGAANTVFAVNLDRSSGESDLTPLPGPPWRLLFPDSLVADFRRGVYGRQARGPLLLAAAFCALVEMGLSAPVALSAAAAAMLLVALGPVAASAQLSGAPPAGSRFVWAQLKLGAGWDPYPTAPAEILESLSQMTSVLSSPERRVLSSLKDPALLQSPIVVLAGREAPGPLDEQDIRLLRDYLSAGGTLWIEDVSGAPSSPFDRWVRATLSAAFPQAPLALLGSDHVVQKTFFLLRRAGGRALASNGPEGLTWDGRTAVIYSRNDLLGVWVKDALGQPLYACTPGGERQRQDGERLAINILMYALTGNYKADAVHQPYLLQKMRTGEP